MITVLIFLSAFLYLFGALFIFGYFSSYCGPTLRVYVVSIIWPILPFLWIIATIYYLISDFVGKKA